MAGEVGILEADNRSELTELLQKDVVRGQPNALPGGRGVMKRLVRSKVLVFVFALIVASPSGFAFDQKSEQAVVKSFKQFAADLVAGYSARKNEWAEPWQMPPCETVQDVLEAVHRGISHAQWAEDHPHFRKGRYEPSTDYGVDVRKTDSLISPYLGVIEFRWFGRYGGCAKTREDAQAGSVSDKVEYDVKYRYTFAFQDGAWVPQGREIYELGISKEDPDKWKDCKDNERDFGCHVAEPSRSKDSK